MIESIIQGKILELFSYLGIPDTQVEFIDDGDTIKINLHIPESDAGIFIGRYAETLDGVQRVVSAIINNGREVHQPVLVDIAGYRDRRYAKLTDIASHLAAEVKEYGTALAFPSGLSATERRQIHLLFSNDETLTTYSEGYGESRRLYLALKDTISA
ncbi:MAG: R3H domain-containing nucleic acid-binding protein [bacterium]